MDDRVLLKLQSLTQPEVLRSWGSPKILCFNIANYTAGSDRKCASSNMAQNSSQSLNIVDNINSFNVVNVNTVISDEDNQIREWLSPLKPIQRHHDVRTDRLDGVGDWFLETSEFRKWSDGDYGSLERVLFCSGGPGVGKTYLW